MRAVTRVATPNNEKQLLTIALGGTAGQVERIVRSWRKVDRIAEGEQVDYQQTHASMTTHTDDDGMLVIRGRLPAEVGAVFLKALEAASDKLYQDDNELPPERRRAQVISEAALNGELDPGTSADRYQVVIHVDEPVLADPENEGQSVLEGGIGVSAETSRRLACDSSIVVMTHDAEGNVLDVGRKTRKISPALRRALDFRDPTCIWPGCDCSFTQAHHIKPWMDDGETKLPNLANLCTWHHHRVHDDGFRIELPPNGKARVFHPNGWEILVVPPPSKLPQRPIAELELEGWEGKPKWGYDRIDMDLVLETMWQPKVEGGEPERWKPECL